MPADFTLKLSILSSKLVISRKLQQEHSQWVNINTRLPTVPLRGKKNEISVESRWTGLTHSAPSGLTVAKSFIMLSAHVTVSRQIILKAFSFPLHFSFAFFFFFWSSNYIWCVYMAEPPWLILSDSRLILRHAGSGSNGVLRRKTLPSNVGCSCPEHVTLLFLLFYMAGSGCWWRLAHVVLHSLKADATLWAHLLSQYTLHTSVSPLGVK